MVVVADLIVLWRTIFARHFGWGKPGKLGARDAAVPRLLREAGVTPFALALNKDGTPKHPLYVRYETVPVKMCG